MVLAALALLGTACASAKPPASARGGASEGPCKFIRLEYSERESDLPSDSAVFTLVYTPPRRGADNSGEVSTKVEVKRERANDLQAQLEARPDLVCRPEPGAPGGYRVELP